MKIRTDHEYSHGTNALYSLFTDTGEITDKQEALGARKIRVIACEKDSDSATVRFVRELPAEVPGILAKFLQPWNRVEQSEEWRVCGESVFQCDLEIDIANVPVTVEGTLKLKPVDGGCVNEVRLVVDCGIPFIGSSLAEFVASDCERLIAEEYDYICDRLGRS
jgi:hypothetical protein